MSATTGNQPNKAPRAARAEASVWVTRLHSEERTPELEAGLRDWLSADAENARQFEHITDVWEVAGAVTADGLPRMRSWAVSASRPHWALAAMAVIVCAIGLFAAFRWWSGSAYVTGKGEQRLVRLEDGSRVSMNSDSRMRVEFGAGERRIWLEKGEAFFDVAHDAEVPFVVVAGQRQVRALGTAFVVRYEGLRTAITLVEGKVTVSADSERESVSSPPPSVFTLAPGQRVTFATGRETELDFPRIQAITAWRRGEVLLEATPLTEAIAEMNRYDERRLVLDDPALATVQVSGIYRTGDSTGFARAVAELHGLKIIEIPDEIHLQR